MPNADGSAAKRPKLAPVASASPGGCNDDDWLSLAYSSGFGNHIATEAVPGTLPVGQNSPQHVAHGLFAEQLSGTAFVRDLHLSPLLATMLFVPHSA